jgi:hypothetical protein
MRSSIYVAKMLTLLSCKAFLICAISSSASAETINLNANFRLFGEVERFGIGYGDMAIHFGVNNSGIAPEIGSLGYYPGGTPFTTGVLSSVSLPGGGFGVVDTTFSVPFSLDIDQPASMYIGFGDNGINGPEGGSVQVIFDFSDNISFVGSLLGNTFDQGLSLVSVTMADGSSLGDAGLSFDFVPSNTVLTAFASAFDDQGVGTIYSTATPLQNRAAVFPFNGTATAKLRGGYNRSGIPTDYLANLDVNPEPDPLVFDLAGATISGAGNVVLTRTSGAIPEPSSMMLVGIGFLAMFGNRLRLKMPGSKRYTDGIGVIHD